MKKLILTSLGIISISLLFLILIKNNNNSDKNNLDTHYIKINDNILEINDKPITEEKNPILTVLKIEHQKTIDKTKNLNEKEIEQKKFYLSYLNYRKEQHQIETKKINHYLTHQKELKHIREGGVKSEIEREKRKYEVQFQHQYKSTMMSQKGYKQKNFMEQKRKMERRREQMQSLKEKQQLQTKYRGEL